MSGPVDDYLTRLEQQLRQRGIDDPRMLAEAREHLVDDIEDGCHRGLSIADAEREAIGRFGAPEVVAAQVLEERDRMRTGFTGVFSTMWQRKWWMLVPTLIAAIGTSVASSYFPPTRYRSEARILVVPAQLWADSTRAVVTSGIEATLRQITSLATSRPQMEKLIEELGLYQDELKRMPLGDAVEQMRRDIRVTALTGDVFNVSYVSADPKKAMQVTEQLAAFVIEGAQKDGTVVVQATTELIDSQIEETREQILAQEKYLETLRAESGGRSLSQAYLIPYETLKESYKALLAKRQDVAFAANLERSQIGNRFRVLEQASLPEAPVHPSRFRVAIGALVGLAIGLALVLIRRTPGTRPPALAEA